MDYVILILLAIVVTAVVTLALAKRTKLGDFIRLSPGKDWRPPYLDFLDVMKTVFKGGDAKQQKSFIELNESLIKKYNFYPDFKTRYDKILKTYKKF